MPQKLQNHDRNAGNIDADAQSCGVEDPVNTLQIEIIDKNRRRGRGAITNTSGRFEKNSREAFDDGWESLALLDRFKTRVHDETARTIISHNDSPDISFDRSINPYRGCEHGCIYCYARPTHTYLGHSAGLDFETQLYAKKNAAELLTGELSKPNYKPAVIALGANTDPYQPIEREQKITRSLLKVLEKTKHPVTIVTKSSGILRDIDILTQMAEQGLVKVAISVTSLDHHLSRKMEPRASTPTKRIDAIEKLANAGIPVGIMMAPVIPALNDHEVETLHERCYEAGARQTGYVMLRLPIELKTLFREWLAQEFPDRAKRVIGLVQSLHGGRDYTSTFKTRQRGSGPYAMQISKRFAMVIKRLGYNKNVFHPRTDLFEPPNPSAGQMSLF